MKLLHSRKIVFLNGSYEIQLLKILCHTVPVLAEIGKIHIVVNSSVSFSGSHHRKGSF